MFASVVNFFDSSLSSKTPIVPSFLSVKVPKNKVILKASTWSSIVWPLHKPGSVSSSRGTLQVEEK